MAEKKKKNVEPENEVVALLQDILITELARAGVGQTDIRAIVKCNMNRVNKIAKHVRRGRNE
jgi:hypothetical protein